MKPPEKSHLLLARAITSGALSNLLWLLSDGADPKGVTEGAGEPLVLLAARKDDPEFLRAMIEAGAEVDARSPAGETPLMAAVRHGHRKNIEYLVEKGANATLKDNAGKNAGALAQEILDQNYLNVMGNALNGVLTPSESAMIEKWEQVVAVLKQAEKDALSVTLKTTLSVKKPLRLKPKN